MAQRIENNAVSKTVGVLAKASVYFLPNEEMVSLFLISEFKGTLCHCHVTQMCAERYL